MSGRDTWRARGAATLGALCVAATAWGGCVQEYDFERQEVERGTFGEEVFRQLRKDAALSPRDHDARSAMLDRDRGSLIKAIDAMVPEDQLTPLNEVLLALGPQYDNDLIPGLTRKLAVVCEEISQDEAARMAWEADAARGATPFKGPGTHSAVVEHALAFPEVAQVSEMITRLVLDHDGFTNGGDFDPGEPSFITDLTRLLSSTLQEQAVSGDPHRFGVQAAGVLTRADESFRPAGATAALPVVALDARGVPRVRASRQGRIYSPFADQDGDGLADLDAQGRFIDASGQPLDVPPFGPPNESGLVVRDTLGRAVAPDGDGFVFDYVDLHSTAASYLLQQNARLMEEDVVFDLADSLQVILPGRVQATDPDTGLTYQGYPADQPLGDLIYALSQVLDNEVLDELLDVANALLRDHPEVVAEVLLALEEFRDLSDAHPEAELAEGNTLVDDLVPVLAEIARRPGLLADVLDALQAPVALRTDVSNVDMFSYRGTPAVPANGGPYDRCFTRCEATTALGTLEHADCVRACPNAEILREPMDLDGPRTEANRSHFEREMALLRDTNRVEFEMLVTRLSIPALDIDVEVGADALPPLLRIDNATAAYLEAVAGNFFLVDYVTDEAIDSRSVELLIDGMDFVCGTSFFGQLIERLVPILIRVTERDLERTCQRFEVISSMNNLPERDRRRQQIAVMVSFLSLLTDVSMNEQPSAAQLARFFNSPHPAVDLEILDLSLGELVCEDGYFLWEHHGDMLFAAEATGLLDALQPIVAAFSAHGSVELIGDLAEVIHNHYAARDVIYLQRNGQPTARIANPAGIQAYEGLIRDWLLVGRLFPALHKLAVANAGITSRRGRPASAVLEDVVRHLFVPQAGLAHADGATTSRREDGEVIQTLSRFYILADAFNEVADRVESNPAAKEKWDRATDEAIDLFIGVEKDQATGEARFKEPGGLVLTRFVAEALADEAARRRDEGTLTSFVQDELRPELMDVLTGPGLPAALDLFNTVNNDPADRALFKRLLRHATGTPEGTGHALVRLYELLVDLGDERSFVSTAHLYGRVLDPDRDFGPGTSPLSLVSHGSLLLRRSLEVDPDDVMLGIIRRGATRTAGLTDPGGDAAGGYPLSSLATIIKQYHRAQPEDTAPMSSQDYDLMCTETGQWLLDDQRGMEQVYDMIKSRKR